MRQLLNDSDAKRFQRFFNDKNIISYDEFEIYIAHLFNHPKIRSITFSVIGLELLHETNWCRRMAFPKTNWSNPKEAWGNLFDDYFTKTIAYVAFRVAFINCVTGGLMAAHLPRCPTWILPRKGVSAVGRFLDWWRRRVGMDTDTFELSVEEHVKDERTMAKWRAGTSSPTIKDILNLADAQYAEYHLDDVTAEWRDSMRVGLFIARVVDRSRFILSGCFDQTTSTRHLETFNSSYRELIKATFSQCIRTYITADKTDAMGLGERFQLAKKVIDSTVEKRSPALPLIEDLHKERWWLAPFEEERGGFIQCLRRLPEVVEAEDSIEAILQTIKDLPDKGDFHAFSIPFFQGLGLILQNDIKNGYDFLWEAFRNARHRACNLTSLIIEITHSTACYLYSGKRSSGQPRKYYLDHIKKMQAWSQWHDLCPKLWTVAQDNSGLSENEERRRVLEIGRHRFEGLFGNWLPEIIATRANGENGKEKFKGRLNKIIKDHGLDTNKLLAAIEDRDEERSLHYIDEGIDLNFRTLMESNAFNKAMGQEGWEAMYRIAEAILSRDIKPISPDTLMTCLRYPEEMPPNTLPETLITSDGQLKYTALHMVLVHRRPSMLHLLIKRGVDMNQRIPTEYGELSPLLYAVLNCSSDVADRPWPGCCKDGYGTSAEAIENVKILLTAKVDVNAVHRDGMTALFQAVLLDNIELVQLLLSHGAETDCPLDMGLTLTNACSSLPMKTLLNQAAKLKEENGYTYH